MEKRVDKKPVLPCPLNPPVGFRKFMNPSVLVIQRDGYHDTM